MFNRDDASFQGAELVPGIPRGWRFGHCDRGAWRPFPSLPESCICGFWLDPVDTNTRVKLSGPDSPKQPSFKKYILGLIKSAQLGF